MLEIGGLSKDTVYDVMRELLYSLNGLHPYDWTDRVSPSQEGWRGNPLFSCISTNLSKSFGER